MYYYAELLSRFPSKFIVFKCLLKAGSIAFLNACFDFVDEGPEEAQKCSLVNLPKILTIHLHSLSTVNAVGFCA